MAKLLLISANNLRDPYPVYPIGISYIKTFLTKYLNDFSIDVFDFNMSTMDDLISILSSKSYNYIGVSIRNIDGANSFNEDDFIRRYKEILSIVRDNSTARIIIGGAGFSIYTESLLRILKPDFGIFGEGENSFKELLERLESNSNFDDIEGLVYWNGQEYIHNEHRNYLKSIELSVESDLMEFYWRESGMLNIQTKRGCPYKCIYCSYPIIDGRTIRTLSVDSVIENIRNLKNKYGVNYLFITDSVFNIVDKYNIELAEALIKANLGVKWGAYFTPGNIKEDILKLYKASGLTHVEFGTESFCDSQLVNYGKDFNFEQVLTSSDLCLKHNIYYSHFLILAGYGETEKSLMETIENSKKLKHTVLFPYWGMRIYPKTKLHEIAINEGVIDRLDDLVSPKYYIANHLDYEYFKKIALNTGKAWVFPDQEQSDIMDVLRKKKNKKGVLWEYLRKP